MNAWYVVRPITDRARFTGPAPSGDRMPFRRSTWVDTEQILRYELERLNARHVVLEVDVTERDIRVDGTLRADARPASPAVRLAFDTDEGPMQFATDRFGWTYGTPPLPHTGGWKHNARAIALGLEALRKVDRYGITSHREQYRGFRALPAGQGLEPSAMTTELAQKILIAEGGVRPEVLNTAAGHAVALRFARANAHPDRHHGDRSRWDAVDEAEQTLRRAGLLTGS